MKGDSPMENDTDVLEFDFPDYEEPYPPFPDVKTADFDKEESYGRNKDIADKLYADDQIQRDRQLAARRSRVREIKARKLAILAACAVLGAALAASAFRYIDNIIDSIAEPPKAVLSEEEKEKLLESKIKGNPFFEAAKVTALLEGVEEDHSGDYAVTINFTVENTSDEEIGFVPHQFIIRLQNNYIAFPKIVDKELFSYGDLENPWNGMYVPAGEQVSFSVKYFISEKNVSQIKCFAYEVYSDFSRSIYLYADIADEDGHVARDIEKEIEKMTN